MSDSKEVLDAIAKLQSTVDSKVDAANTAVSSTLDKIDDAKSLIDRIKDNIAYILGLPATIGGAFGFLWDSGNEQAELSYQVAQLETAVADLKAENDLLGGGQKNFSLDLSGAPAGSLIPIVIGVALILVIGGLFLYQSKRKRQ
jgi:archaellum component FlaC